MDKQDGQDTGLKHADLTGTILACAFEVINELDAGFLESVYEKAMLIVIEQKGLESQSQRPIEVRFRGRSVGGVLCRSFR